MTGPSCSMYSPLLPRLVSLPSKIGESCGAEAYFGQSQYWSFSLA